MNNYDVTVRKQVLIRGRRVSDTYTSVVTVYHAANGHEAMKAAAGHGVPIGVKRVQARFEG